MYRPTFGGGADRELQEKEFTITKSAGLFASRQFPESAVPPNALYDCQDIVPGTFRVRRGSGSQSSDNAYWNPNIAATPVVTGMFSFRRHDGTSELIAAIGGGIYKRTGAVSKTTLETGLTANNFEFATMNDVLYYVNGDNGLRQYDGATAAAVTAKTAAASETANYLSDAGNAIHNSRYISVHDKVVYLASPLSNPYRLYRSDELVGPTYFHNYIDIISERGGEIRWITTFAGKLIVLKSDSIWAVDGLIGDGTIGVRRLHNQVGCAVGRTVQEVPGLGLVFMGSDKHFYVLRPDYVNGENIPLLRLSSHISDLIELLPLSTLAYAAGVDKNVYTCSVDMAADLTQARHFVFDFTRVESIPNDPTSLFVPWSIYVESAHKVFVRHVESGVEYLFGAPNMWIYYFEHPTNLALKSSAVFELYNLDFGKSNVRKFHPTLNVVANNSSTTVQPAISVDDDTYTNLSTIDTSGDGTITRAGTRFSVTSTAPKVGTFRVNVNRLGYRFRYKFTITTTDYKREFLELRFLYQAEEVR